MNSDLDMSLTMAQGMKRLGMPIAAFLGLALIGLIGTSWFLNRDALRQAVEAQIRAVTGLDLVVKGEIEVSVFPGSYVSFHDVGLKGGAHHRPRAAGRRADREFAAAAAVAAAVRDRRRHDAASAYPCGPRRQRREQLDAVRRDHRAHHEARRREPGVVLGNPDPGRRARLRGRRQPRLRAARRHRPVAGLAVDLALVCRDRAVRLARRARRRLDQRQRFRRRAVRRPFRPEGAARQRAAETRLRRHRRQPHQPDDGRHR